MKTTVERKATTILAADIVGYSKLVSEDEGGTIEEFRSILRLFVRPTIVKQNGRLVKFMGDAFIAEFHDTNDALHCAIRIQSDLTVHNATVPTNRKIIFRMGLHWGDVAIEGEDLFGDTVNIASRLEGLADSAGIMISEVVKSTISNVANVGFEDKGFVELKNIPTPVQVHAVQFDPALFAVKQSGATLQPYRGLLAFREEDAGLFFGRDVFVDLLRKAVSENSLVAVIGSSGSGKSSVVAAGLLPRMRESNWLIAQFRPGSQPFVELANALQPLMLPDVSQSAQRSAAQSLADTLQRGELRLDDICKTLYRRYPESNGLVLVADQFEEFLTLCTDRLQRELFQDLIVSGRQQIRESIRLGEQVLPLVIVTTLRADFMGRLLEYRPLADAMQDGDIKLGPMTRKELQQTIELPAQKQGVGFAPGLVERILDDVGEKTGNLPLLQFALTALWEKDAELGAELSHQAYDEIGRVQGALAYHADDVYDALQPLQQSRAHQIFVQLVQPGEGVASTRRIATRTELGEEGWQLVQRLADSRLVITGRNTAGDETVEVVHEALIRDWERLGDWLREDFSFRSWQERLRGAMQQWTDSEKDRGELLRGAALAQAHGWVESHGQRLNDIEREFIDHSKQLFDDNKRIEKEQLQRELDLVNSQKNERKFKGFSTALAAVLALAVGAAAFAWKQQQSAVQAREIAELERGVAQQARDRTDEALMIAESARIDAEEARTNVQAAKDEVDLLNRQILSQQLAAEAALANDSPADRAAGLPLLLGMEAVKATLESDGHSMLVANNALRQAVRTAPTLPSRRLVGHDGKIEAIHFSEDGMQLVTGGNDKLVNIWDVESGKLLHTLEGHQQRVTQARFVDNDKRIVTASMDATVRLWDSVSGNLVQTISDHEGAVFDLQVSQVGDLWSTISYDGTARIIEAISGETLHVLAGQEEPLYTAGFSPDGTRIATAGDITAALWDTKTGALVQMMDTGISAIRTINFSADSRLLVIRGEDNHVDVRDATSGERIYQLQGHDDAVIWSATFSPDSQNLLTAGGDGTVRIWSAADGNPLKTLIGRGAAVSNAVYSPDGTLIASAAADGAATLWSTEQGKALHTMEGHQSAVTSIKFREDGQWIATAGEDGAASIWSIADLIANDVPDGFSLSGHGSGGQALAFDPIRAVVASAGYNGALILWDTNDGSVLRKSQNPGDSAYYVDFRPDGKELISVGGSGEITFWQADNLEMITSVPVASSAAIWAQYSHNGRYVIVTSVDSTASILDAQSRKVLHKLEGHEGALFWAGFSPDDAMVATASYADNTVRIWDVETGKAIHVLKGHSGGIYRCGFSADGQRIVTASNDTTAKIWSLKSGNMLFDLEGHTSTVRAAMFSPNDRYVVTASYDNTAKIWDAETGTPLRTLSGHQANLMTIAFGPDPSWFVTTSYDTTAKIWDIETGVALHTLQGHTDKLEASAISKDGRLIITQGHDDTPRLWHSDITDLLQKALEKLPRENPHFTTGELRRFGLGNLLQRREQAEVHIEAAKKAAAAGFQDEAEKQFELARTIDATSHHESDR